MKTNKNFYFIKVKGQDWTIARFDDRIDCFITFGSEVYHWSEVEVSKKEIEFPVDVVVDDYDKFLDEIFY